MKHEITHNKGSTKEALPWNGQQKITGGLTRRLKHLIRVSISSLVLVWIKAHSFNHMRDPLLIDASSPSNYKPKYKKGDKTKIINNAYNRIPDQDKSYCWTMVCLTNDMASGPAQHLIRVSLFAHRMFYKKLNKNE